MLAFLLSTSANRRGSGFCSGEMPVALAPAPHAHSLRPEPRFLSVWVLLEPRDLGCEQHTGGRRVDRTTARKLFAVALVLLIAGSCHLCVSEQLGKMEAMTWKILEKVALGARSESGGWTG